MEFKIYPLLANNSRRSMKKVKKTHRGYYGYFPQYRLLKRLTEALNLSENEVLSQIQKEREYLIALNSQKI